jgi:hypothetical protein
MKNKRGLSQVVTTALIIAISIVLLATIWILISGFLSDESSKLRTDKLTTGMKLEYARVDLENETATVKVARDPGEGNVTGIKIIVEDDKNAISFDEYTGSFLELEKRTLELNLAGTIIVPSKIKRISIAPILYSSASGITFGQEYSLETNEIVEIGFENVEEPINETTEEGCTADSDCGEDYFMPGTEYCNSDNTAVRQYKKDFSCESGFCYEETYSEIIEYCLDGTFCQDAECIEESTSCTSDSECGTDGWVGIERCDTSKSKIVQDYVDYSCIDGSCESSTTEQIKQECAPDEICYQAECFVPLECTSNSDCDLGYVCENGECVEEFALNTGTVNTVWPFNLAEYFDSVNLERAGVDYTGRRIIFPGSNESRCLTVIDHVLPENPDWYAYVRLNDDRTDVRAGDYYEIWETAYACTLV